MKKSIATLLLIFTTSLIFSQDIDFGIKAGANFANITDAKGLSNKTGFQAGLFLGLHLTDKFAIQPELLYSQQGGKFDLGEFDLTYVNLPVIAKIYLAQGFNFQVGPQFGFVVDKKVNTLIGTIKTDAETENFDLSAAVGVGYDFPFGARFDARYNFGLTDVTKNSNSKNSVFSVALGYSFL